MLELRKVMYSINDDSGFLTNKDDEMRLYIDLDEVPICVLNRTECDDQKCEGCNMTLPISVGIEFEQAYTTEQAFIFESANRAQSANNVHFSVILPKNQAPDHEVKEAALSKSMMQQLAGLGIEKPIGFFVRTWYEEQTRQHPEGRRFVELLAPEHSNALLVFAIWEGLPLGLKQWKTGPFCEYIEKTFGSIDYDFIKISAEIDGPDFGYEYWIFQYDPKTDRLRIPSDPAEDKIDTLLHRQEIGLRLRSLQERHLRYVDKRTDAIRAQVFLRERDQLREDIELLKAMYDCFDTISNRNPNELRQFFIDVRGASITCGQSNLLRTAQACLDDLSAENIAKARQAAEESLECKNKELIRADQDIQANDFAGLTLEKLQMEIDQLNPLIKQLQPQIDSLLTELGIETSTK